MDNKKWEYSYLLILFLIQLCLNRPIIYVIRSHTEQSFIAGLFREKKHSNFMILQIIKFRLLKKSEQSVDHNLAVQKPIILCIYML